MVRHVQQLQTALTILRRKQVEAAVGGSRSTIYLRISQGLFTKPVSLGARAVGWPAHEVDAINAARIASKSDDEIRDLVQRLQAARGASTKVLMAEEAKSAIIAAANRTHRTSQIEADHASVTVAAGLAN